MKTLKYLMRLNTCVMCLFGLLAALVIWIATHDDQVWAILPCIIVGILGQHWMDVIILNENKELIKEDET